MQNSAEGTRSRRRVVRTATDAYSMAHLGAPWSPPVLWIDRPLWIVWHRGCHVDGDSFGGQEFSELGRHLTDTGSLRPVVRSDDCDAWRFLNTHQKAPPIRIVA